MSRSRRPLFRDWVRRMCAYGLSLHVRWIRTALGNPHSRTRFVLLCVTCDREPNIGRGAGGTLYVLSQLGSRLAGRRRRRRGRRTRPRLAPVSSQPNWDRTRGTVLGGSGVARPVSA
eukprot:4148952-Prymnesium_polylepis.2